MGWTPGPRRTVGTCPFCSSCRSGRSVLTCLFGSRGSHPSSLPLLPSPFLLEASTVRDVPRVVSEISFPLPPGISIPWNLNRRCSPDLLPARISTVGARSPTPVAWAADTSPFPFRLIPPSSSPSSSLAPYRSRADLRRTPSCRGRPSETQPEGILSLCVCLSPCLCLCGVWQTHKSRRGR